ncbi:MAG: hypothetical protein IPM74_13060 [Crocinitomicaceae bacterium]|nr:hypothetical protein [Crocinitomicaceae bacterium]MBK8926804.1 hypothetical protein [Crocinitomicaceae bacterium]
MKKMKKGIFLMLAASLCVTISSCDPAKKYANEIEKIDSCLTVIDEYDSLYHTIQFDSLQWMVNHVLENENAIKQYGVSDTVPQLLGSWMNNCKGVRKSLKDIGGNKMKFNDEIFFMRRQFTNLKTDIINGVYDKDEIEKYLKIETEALTNFGVMFGDFYDLQKSQSAIFYDAVPNVDAYVLLIKNEHGDTMP